jgi:hypothetical protein
MDFIDLLLDDEEQTMTGPVCPICEGPLILQRDYFRCSRCAHSFCESCEGGLGNDP